jgi:hypothetical protein
VTNSKKDSVVAEKVTLVQVFLNVFGFADTLPSSFTVPQVCDDLVSIQLYNNI